MSTQSNEVETKSRMSLKIEGMHCASCVATVEKSLLKQQGVVSATVSLLDEKAVIEYELGKVNRSVLEQAVNSTGYRARRPTAALTLSPHPEQQEWESISEKVKGLDGIISVRSYPDSGRLMVEYDDDLVTPRIVKRTLKSVGYEATENFRVTGGQRVSSEREGDPVLLKTAGFLRDTYSTCHANHVWSTDAIPSTSADAGLGHVHADDASPVRGRVSVLQVESQGHETWQDQHGHTHHAGHERGLLLLGCGHICTYRV